MALIDLGVPEDPEVTSPPRPRVPKHVAWGVAGLLVGAVAVGVYTSSSATPARPVAVPSPRAVTTPPPHLPDDASDLIAGANRRLSPNVLGGVTVASVSSRLLAWPVRDDAPRETSFRSTGRQPAGDYMLLMFCVGTGRVAVVLRVGVAIQTEIADCADAAAASELLLLGAAAGDVEVRMTAVDAEDVAISAAVTRS